MDSGTDTTAANAWVESYLNALLTFGLSGEYASATDDRSGPDADKSLYSRYYVRSLLNLDEENLKNAWAKAVSSGNGEKDMRLEYLSWRIWHLKRKHAEVEARKDEEDIDDREEKEDEDTDEDVEDSNEQDVQGEDGASRLKPAAADSEASNIGTLGISLKPIKIKSSSNSDRNITENDFNTMFEDSILSPLSHQDATPHSIAADSRPDRLYVVMISLHGLVRGEQMELGRDSDTGGQVKYVVELAKAMSLHPAVYRVDLLTRMIKDPKVHSDYGVEEECIAKGCDDLGGSYIVRLPCGPTEEYIPKEKLWPHIREFSDRGILHIRQMLDKISDSGRFCSLYCVHGHYADAGEAAVLICSTLGVPQVTTGHSLGRNKLEHLLSSGGMTRSEIEATYNIGRRIEAEERCLDVADVVFTSTQQEVDEQWGLYDGFNPKLARVLRIRSSTGRHMPFMKVSPPGLDFSNLKVNIPEDPVVKEFRDQRALMMENELNGPFSPHEEYNSVSPAKNEPSPIDIAQTSNLSRSLLSQKSAAGSFSSGIDGATLQPGTIIPNGSPIWQDIARFLRNPLKPAVLAMSRPDSKKNITTLVKAFGEHAMLRELANLVLVMGNRDNIDSMATGSQKVLTQVLKLIDKYDLYGSVAYPKHHGQNDISDIYSFAGQTRGVFVNIALQEPFGLTVIEAAAHGVPTVATCNGGPVDIMATLHHGVVVDPTDSDAIADALLSILTSPETWDVMSDNGVENIMSYSWPAHCKRYMETMDFENQHKHPYSAQNTTYTGQLRKRMSRLDLLGIADMDGVPDSPVIGSNFGDSVHRQMSSPGELTPFSGLATPPAIKQLSGFTTDDIDAIQSMRMEAALHKLKGDNNKASRVRKQKYVIIPIDCDNFAEEASNLVKETISKLEEAGVADFVGVGILSMLGFESTVKYLTTYGAGLSVSFIICNGGADIWVCDEFGEWHSVEEYENLISFNWDRNSLHRMLKKIVSYTSEDAQHLPKLKELLYNVGEEKEESVHPKHICIELDPETQQILASGMGPRARSTHPLRLLSVIVARLKRKVRTKGLRATYTLQIVRNKSPRDHLAILHITPVRASRAMALRFLAQYFGISMSDFTALVIPACMKGDSKLDGVLVPWTSDTGDIVAGMQNVQILVPCESSPIFTELQDLQGLDESLGIPLWPWNNVDRVHVSHGVEASLSGVIQFLCQNKIPHQV